LTPHVTQFILSLQFIACLFPSFFEENAQSF
jgi:hypothetical protein